MKKCEEKGPFCRQRCRWGDDTEVNNKENRLEIFGLGSAGSG
jgi:hypothetical protein